MLMVVQPKKVNKSVEFVLMGKRGDESADGYSNSGVYLQNRYEIQVLDGDKSKHGMGAIINESESPYEFYRGTGTWNATGKGQ